MFSGPIPPTATSLYFLEKKMEHLNVELNQAIEAVDMDTGEPVLPVVSTFRNIFEIKEPVVEKRPSMGGKKAKQVEEYLNRATNLIAKYQIVEQDHMKRGHKALYECLASTYDFALDVFSSPLKEDILESMRERSKNTSGKMPSSKTPDMTLIVKYVVGDTDRQLAHVYSRGLRVAYEEDIPVTSLVKYIEDAGGISKITATTAEKAQKKLLQDTLAERAELLRRYYVARGYTSTSPQFIFNEPILQWDIKTAQSKKDGEKESSNETGDFVIMLAVVDPKTKKLRPVEGNDFGASFEMSMFRHMAARIKTDVVKMKVGVQNAERTAWGETLEERRERFLKEDEERKAKMAKETKVLLEGQGKRGLAKEESVKKEVPEQA